MRPVEIIALIMVLVGLIKMLVLFIKPKKWLDEVVKPVYLHGKFTKLAAFVVALIVLNYLLKEVTIVQIFAVFVFVASIVMIGFASYGQELTAMAEKIMKDKNMFRKSWLSVLIWLVLSAWVLFELFFK